VADDEGSRMSAFAHPAVPVTVTAFAEVYATNPAALG
jgi:hypothetical protein